MFRLLSAHHQTVQYLYKIIVWYISLLHVDELLKNSSV
jgi:hypothetical protein